MSEVLIAVRNLEVSLPDMAHKLPMGRAPMIHILKGLNFDVPRGSVIGIVGESGSGKSTLGRAILRLIEPTAGTVIFDDEDITHTREKSLRGFRQKAQMIFQDPLSSLNPRHTILGLIAAPLTLRMGRAEARTRAAEALEMVGLPANFARRYPHEISGGQRQRVGIARAIAQRPTFILADEIASGLDVSSQAVILSLLQDLVRDLGPDSRVHKPRSERRAPAVRPHHRDGGWEDRRRRRHGGAVHTPVQRLYPRPDRRDPAAGSGSAMVSFRARRAEDVTVTHDNAEG